MIDFIIIGAMKSGTTSLHQYLSVHPEIYMPAQKELQFFSRDEFFSNGVDWYLDQWFRGKEQYRCGEASPQYMCYQSVPERIYNNAPKAKLIAVLRNPIDRAYSHYRLTVRQCSESRNFDTAVAELVARGHVSDDKVDFQRDYVMFGEYGRILENYLKFFQKDQVRVIFDEDLMSRRREVLRSLFSFLGVSPDLEASVFDKAYHVSGIQRYPSLTNWFVKHKAVRSFMRDLLPSDLYEKLRLWYWTEFNVKQVKDPGPSDAVRRVLREHYRKDVELLERLLGVKTPWPEFHSYA